MFDFLKKRAPKWEDLNSEQQKTVTKSIMTNLAKLHKYRNEAGPRYRIVQGVDQFQRPLGTTEMMNEDWYLNSYRRNRLLDMTRNAVRNSSTFNTILKQFDLNVVGINGGKVILNFEDQNLGKDIKKLFVDWTHSADFFDGYSLNQLLKIILKQQLIGGDVVIMFDDDLIEDSGKLVVYESDELVNLAESDVQKYYGKGCHMSIGKVYNPNGRWIGSVVSRSQRGVQFATPDKCYMLHRDPDKPHFDQLWLQPANTWRPNQGRGISQASSSIGTILDLEDLCGFELQAAKKNAQTFAQIYKNASDQQGEVMPSAFDTDTDFSSMTDEDIEAAAKEEVDSDEQVVTFNKAASAGIIYEQIPEGWQMSLLDTKHPNDNTQDFIKWLAGRSSSVFGLSEAYATLMPTNDFRTQQLMTQPTFIEAQKQLEQILDWVLVRFLKWSANRGLFDMSRLEEGWLKYVNWSWPRLDEIDQQAFQSATEMKLRNMTGSYAEYYGPDWQQKLVQIQKEIDWCKEHNLPHPAYSMISGGERTGADSLSSEKDDNLTKDDQQK